MIRVGDRVKFINDVGSGRVVSISGSTVEVDVVDGFIVPYLASDLVVVSEEEEIAVIERIGVSDERPGAKKRAVKSKEEAIKSVVKRKEPSYARYGKISLVDDDFEDEYLDMNRIDEQYRRNKAAAEEREREFEAIRERQQRANENIVESSPVLSTEEEKTIKEPTVGDELQDKLKQEGVKPQSQSQKKKEKKSPEIEVIDLHAHEILENLDGLSNGEIIVAQLSRFTLALDLAAKSGKHGKMIFIHGVGSGKLRREIDTILRREYPKLVSQDASFKEYGYGAILIIY